MTALFVAFALGIGANFKFRRSSPRLDAVDDAHHTLVERLFETVSVSREIAGRLRP
jgi:hypothetical protein